MKSILTSVARAGFRGVLGLFGVAALLFGASSNANAACGRFNELGSKNSIKLPIMQHADIGFPGHFGETDHSIVGLWHVIYTTGSGDESTTFNDTFDTWHSDGTEFESAFLAPVGGDVCVGVWKRTGEHTVTLHHIGWLFSPFDSKGNPTNLQATATNYFTLDEIVTVAEDGASYSGTFTFKIWNLDGSPTGVTVPGTIAATRITVD